MNTSPMTPERVADLIRAGLPGAMVRVESDDNTHFAARIIAPQFAGKRPIARHQLIYSTLGVLMGREIHALSIDALTPDEAAAAGKN
jgi:acid stress-induced BolA-like protein IbaG/YrbA